MIFRLFEAIIPQVQSCGFDSYPRTKSVCLNDCLFWSVAFHSS
jgi:hypothetical protein